jgi:hypothetical protein
MVDTGQNIDSHSDGSDTNNSARKHNTYIFTLNGKNTKKVNGGVVFGAKNEPVEEYLRNIYKKLDSKPLIAKVKTDPTSLDFKQMSFYDAVQKCLNNSSIRGENSSYCFVYYDKDSNPTLASYENRFSGSPVADFIEDPTNTDPNDGIIINVSPSNIFMNSAETRKCDADTCQFNPLNGGLRLGVKPKTDNFRTAGRNPGKKGAGNENNTIHNCPDPLNNKCKQGKYSTAADRYNFQSANLNDNAAEFTVFSRPRVDIGNNINASILAKDDKNTTTGNPKINGKMLVRTIIHRIGAVGEEPRYTQVLQTLKGDPEGR